MKKANKNKLPLKKLNSLKIKKSFHKKIEFPIIKKKNK